MLLPSDPVTHCSLYSTAHFSAVAVAVGEKEGRGEGVCRRQLEENNDPLEMYSNRLFSNSNRTEPSNVELESNRTSRVELRTEPNFFLNFELTK